jgi:potassium-dependent mechanosensitive channel
MNVRVVRRNLRLGLSAWLLLGFAFDLFAGVVSQPDAEPVSVKAPERSNRPVAFPVTQAATTGRALATSPAVSSEPAPATQPATQPASQPSTQPTSAPSTQPRNPDLTLASLESYKKQIQATQDISDAERENILKIYDKAAEQLKQADYWQEQGARADESIRQIPDLLEKANARLKQPVEDLSVKVPDNATLAQIEQRCRDAEEMDRVARMDAGRLNREQQSYQDRKTEIQNRRNAIRQRQAALGEQLNGLQATATPGDQAQAFLLRATRRALYREYNALEKQGNSDEARQELLTVLIDLANRYQQATGQALAPWRALLKERRAAETARVAALASQQSVAFQDSPELFDIVKANRDLAARRVRLQALTDEIQQATESRDAVAAQRQSLDANRRYTEKRIDTAGLTEAISSLLRRQRAQLPDILQHERSIVRLESEIASAQTELVDLEDQRADLVNIDRQVEKVVRGLKNPPVGRDLELLRGQVQDLLRTKRKHLDDLIGDYGTCTKGWFELQEEERFLIDDTRKYANYIDEHILWVRSTRPLQPADAAHTWTAVRWFLDPANWLDVGAALWNDLLSNPLTVVAGWFLFGALAGLRPRIRHQLRRIDEMASKGYTYTFGHTLRATALTLLLTIPWVGLVWFIGWRLSSAVTASPFATALAAGLTSTAGLFLGLELPRQICRQKGLGQTHFHWPAETMHSLRDNLAWLMVLMLPLTFVYVTIDEQPNAEMRDSLGRLAFIASMLAVMYFTRRVLQPRGPLLAPLLQRHRDGWLDRLHVIWFPAAVAIPAALALAAALGYSYTALQLASRILATVILVFVAYVARALLLRLLFVGRRKLAVEAAQKRMAARSQGKEPHVPPEDLLPVQDTETAAKIAPSEPEVDLARVDTQTRRLARIAILIALAIGLYLTWVDMLPALGILDRVQLWSTSVDVTQPITNQDGTKSLLTTQKLVPITLGSIAVAGLIMLGAIAAARNIPGLLEITLLRLMPMEPGSRYAINAISRYVITILGLIFAFEAIGIGWSKVQWLAAAVTVGLGFGLQEIFANFVSGLIILFERPVRVGDVISIGEISGTVTRIRIRATTIVDWNRKELIVPNKQFITSQTVNWTLSDPILRLVLLVGVPYGSDPEQVRRVLLSVARSNARVLDNPKPSVFLLGFAKDAMNFSMRVFVASPDMILSVQDQLHAALGKALREEGIEATFSRSPG